MSDTPNIRTIDMMFLDELLGMEGGYVLNFSDKTMREFFAGELNIDIDDPCYAVNGTSKGKRLRCFLQTVDKPTVVRVLNALWEYREAVRMKFGQAEKMQNAHGRLLTLLDKMQSGRSTASTKGVVAAADNREIIAKLKTELTHVMSLQPQPRGYAFETFLKNAFDAFGLQAREPFKLRGEQIDGSFLLRSETYLLEAKWQNEPTSALHLHGFHGKIEQKAAFTRGLFVSYAGFTEEGLDAFGRGKRIVCMNGLDLSEMILREIPLNHILEMKVRRFAETGVAFIPVSQLFPK